MIKEKLKNCLLTVILSILFIASMFAIIGLSSCNVKKTILSNDINIENDNLNFNKNDLEPDFNFNGFGNNIYNSGQTANYTLNKLGGMSYKSENLLNLTDVSETTYNGITYSVHNGVITLNGTASDIVYIYLNISSIVSGYYSLCYFNLPSSVYVWWGLSNGSFYSAGGTLTTNNLSYNNINFTSDITSFRIRVDSGTSLTNYKINPMLVSGTTAPTEFKPYFEGIRDSAVTSVVSKNSNNEIVSTLSIPRELLGSYYGIGINENLYNYIDFTSKEYVQKVGIVDLGSLNYTYDSTNELFYTSINDKTSSTNLLCYLYESVNVTLSSMPNMSMRGTAGAVTIYFKNTAYDNATTFKTAMSGVYLYYELETPKVIDISDYLLDDFSFYIYEDGYVDFVNEYNYSVYYDLSYNYSKVLYDSIYNDGYNAGITFADNRVNTDSASYIAGYNAGISYADGRVNTDSASYTNGYNAGITYADGRVNTDSASYTNGYNAGITFADGRVNTDSASYTAGYNAGYTSGLDVAYSNNPFYNATFDYYFNLNISSPGISHVVGDNLLQGDTFLSIKQFLDLYADPNDKQAYVENTNLSYWKLTFAKSFPLDQLVLNFDTNQANTFDYYITYYFEDSSSYLYHNASSSDYYRSFSVDLTQVSGLSGKMVTAISFRRQYSYDVNTISIGTYLIGFNDGYADGASSANDKINDLNATIEEKNTIISDLEFTIRDLNERLNTNINNLFYTMISAVMSTPFNILHDYLNWNFFGINLFSLFTSLVTLLIILWVVKFLLGRK